MVNSLNFVVYMGGTCGDLITAMIDSTDARLGYQGQVLLLPDQVKLKKPHQFISDDERDQYVQAALINYRSLSSHDIEYHQRKHHQFLAIGVKNYITATWAARRFKDLHQPHVWEEMMQVCGAKTVGQYAETMLHYTNLVEPLATHVIWLEDILVGEVHIQLQQYFQTVDVEFYQSWLKANT
jgi:hypothetical protein